MSEILRCYCERGKIWVWNRAHGPSSRKGKGPPMH